MSNKINYFVTINKLGDSISKSNKVLLNQLQAKLADTGCDYQPINEVAQRLYDKSEDRYLRDISSGVQTKKPKLASKREFLLHAAVDVVILSYSIKAAYHEFMVRLNDNKGCYYWNPYADPMLVDVTDLEVFNNLLDAEAAKGKAWYNENEFEVLNACIKYEQIAILNTPTPWLGADFRLHTLAKQFPTFDAFLDYCQGIIKQLEERPNTDWDYDMTVSPVMRPKADQSHYVVTKAGTDKGRRAFSTKEHDDNGYWYNYEVLPVDILKKFLHLTFLDSINYKPLIRLESDGVEYGTRHYFEFEEDEDMEQGLMTTPLYFDPYFHTEEC